MLAQQLAEWAADNGQVQALSQMPLPPAVEHALLGWLVRLSDVQLLAGTMLLYRTCVRLPIYRDHQLGRRGRPWCTMHCC